MVPDPNVELWWEEMRVTSTDTAQNHDTVSRGAGTWFAYLALVDFAAYLNTRRFGLHGLAFLSVGMSCTPCGNHIQQCTLISMEFFPVQFVAFLVGRDFQLSHVHFASTND